MNLLFLSPHFPSNFQLFCAGLHQAGIHVLGIDQVPYEELSQELRASLHDYYRVSDLHKYSEIVQACNYFSNRYGPIHRIESHNEYWLQTQANLATQFQIPGLNNEMIDRVKRKSLMKQVFERAGMLPARGELVDSVEQALTFVRQIGYPVMMKPDIGVGAFGCCKIHNESELRDFFKRELTQDYLMEEFINGTICSFDGLVGSDGTLLFCAAHIYGAGIAEVVRHNLDQIFYSLREIPADLEQIGRKTLAAFDVKERFFHFEYFRTKDNQLIPIEVNMRPPGSPTLDMCNFACDIDLYQWWAELIAGGKEGRQYERKYHCMSISRRNQNEYLYSHEEVLAKGHGLIVHHDSVPPLCRATMGDYFYVARAPCLETLRDLQKYIGI